MADLHLVGDVLVNLCRRAALGDLGRNVMNREFLADAGDIGGLARAVGKASEDDSLSALRKLLDLANDIRSLANRGGGGNFSSGYGDIGCQCFGRCNVGGGGRGRVHIGSDLHGRGIDSGNRSLGADLGDLRRNESDGGNLNGRVNRVCIDRLVVESRRQILSPVTHLEDFWRGSDTEVSVVETVCW
jgi:hypothetical protein